MFQRTISQINSDGTRGAVSQLRATEEIVDELLREGSQVCLWACKMSDTDIQRSSEHVGTFDSRLPCRMASHCKRDGVQCQSNVKQPWMAKSPVCQTY